MPPRVALRTIVTKKRDNVLLVLESFVEDMMCRNLPEDSLCHAFRFLQQLSEVVLLKKEKLKQALRAKCRLAEKGGRLSNDYYVLFNCHLIIYLCAYVWDCYT